MVALPEGDTHMKKISSYTPLAALVALAFAGTVQAQQPIKIGLVLECPAPLLFNKNLRNLPKPKAYIGWDSYGLSTYHPEAFYYEGGNRG